MSYKSLVAPIARLRYVRRLIPMMLGNEQSVLLWNPAMAHRRLRIKGGSNEQQMALTYEALNAVHLASLLDTIVGMWTLNSFVTSLRSGGEYSEGPG